MVFSELSNDENEPDTSLTTNIVPIYLSFKPGLNK